LLRYRKSADFITGTSGAPPNLAKQPSSTFLRRGQLHHYRCNEATGHASPVGGRDGSKLAAKRAPRTWPVGGEIGFAVGTGTVEVTNGIFDMGTSGNAFGLDVSGRSPQYKLPIDRPVAEGGTGQ
jgi:hypothetical protein